MEGRAPAQWLLWSLCGGRQGTGRQGSWPAVPDGGQALRGSGDPHARAPAPSRGGEVLQVSPHLPSFLLPPVAPGGLRSFPGPTCGSRVGGPRWRERSGHRPVQTLGLFPASPGWPFPGRGRGADPSSPEAGAYRRFGEPCPQDGSSTAPAPQRPALLAPLPLFK